MLLHHVLKQLSHSSTLLLHACPRKYELTKLLGRSDNIEDSEDLTFGEAVGTGIQQLLMGVSVKQVWINLFVKWKRDIIDVSDKEEKKKKTIWHAYNALEIFNRIHLPQLLEEYDVAKFDGKLACELSFRIDIGSGFAYRGFVDAVLLHKKTKELMVLEIKTTASKFVNPAKFQNSGQALGYSLVCDLLAHRIKEVAGSSYRVLYLVFKSPLNEYEPLPFNKSHSQRAMWIKNLLIEVDTLLLYEKESCFPMHGESCESWGRACEFLNVCNLSNEFVVHGANPAIKEENYTFEIPLLDLINAQLERHQQEILQP